MKLGLLLLPVLFGVASAIVNGEKPDRSSHPWSVSLQIGATRRKFCSGSLIDRRWVLTNAHCTEYFKYLMYYNEPIFALLGAHNLEDANESGRQVVTVSEIYSHPSYTGGSHDVGLVRLAKPAKVGMKYIGVIPGFASESDYKGIARQRRRCFVYGWGIQLVDGVWTSRDITLRRVEVRLLPCHRKGFNWPSVDNICYKTVIPGTSTCGGDSGSPIVCKHHGKWLQTVVHAFSTSSQGKCRTRFKGGYKAYMNFDFIRNVTGLVV